MKRTMTKMAILIVVFAAISFVSPADGASSFSIGEVAGRPRILVDGVPKAGLCAFPDPRGGVDYVPVMREFAAIGVDIYSYVWGVSGKSVDCDWWLGEGKYDFDVFDGRVRKLLSISPSVVFFPRLQLNPPKWWAAAHPAEMRGGHAKPDSAAWRALYRRMIADVVRHVDSSDYAHRIIGYHIGALHCGEWLVWPTPAGEIPPVTSDPRDPLPPYEQTAARRDYVVRRERAVADALLDAAKWTKQQTKRRLLVGVFFGYQNAGDHSQIARVLRSPDVDFFASPGVYTLRRGGQAGRFQAEWTASFRLHGKLYFDETDIRTCLSPERDKVYGTKTPEESVGVIRRNIGYALTGGLEAWWFLLGGNDSFSDPRFMSPLRIAFAEAKATLTSPRGGDFADVAVFTSASDYVTNPHSDAGGKWADRVHVWLKRDFVHKTMPFAGVAYDSYELEDIAEENLPDYKVYVFVNAMDVPERLRAAMKKRVRRPGKSAVWLFAPGYWRGGAGSAANVSELVGFDVRELPGGEGDRYSRKFSSDVGESGVLTEGGGRAFYFPAVPDIETCRRVFANTGAHVWTDTPEVVSAGRGYLMVHAASDGAKTIRLPGAFDVTELFDGGSRGASVSSFSEMLRKGDTRLYVLKNGNQDTEE